MRARGKRVLLRQFCQPMGIDVGGEGCCTPAHRHIDEREVPKTRRGGHASPNVPATMNGAVAA
jgi:hypothetical protein